MALQKMKCAWLCLADDSTTVGFVTVTFVQDQDWGTEQNVRFYVPIIVESYDREKYNLISLKQLRFYILLAFTITTWNINSSHY